MLTVFFFRLWRCAASIWMDLPSVKMWKTWSDPAAGHLWCLSADESDCHRQRRAWESGWGHNSNARSAVFWVFLHWIYYSYVDVTGIDMMVPFYRERSYRTSYLHTSFSTPRVTSGEAISLNDTNRFNIKTFCVSWAHPNRLNLFWWPGRWLNGLMSLMAKCGLRVSMV